MTDTVTRWARWGVIVVCSAVLAYTIPRIVLNPQTDWEVAGPMLGGSLAALIAALAWSLIKRRRA